MRGSRIVSAIACASIQASWTLGNCFLNMFLNMVDHPHLIGAGVCRTLSLRRAHPLPKIVLFYTHNVRSATQFRCLKKCQTPLGLKNSAALGSALVSADRQVSKYLIVVSSRAGSSLQSP